MRLVFVFYLLIASQAVAELKQPEILLASASPAKVPANGSVAITLTLQDQRKNRPFSFSKKEFSFVIAAPPQHGVLTQLQQFPRQAQFDRATVVYTHSGDNNTSVDTFAFEARSDDAVVSGVAKIQILQPQLTIEPKTELNFGSIIAEQSSSQEIFLFNSGEVPVKGVLTIAPPFSLSDSLYSLSPNERKKIIIQCQPPKAGVYQAQLQFSFSPQLHYRLEATALSPLAFFPEILDLGTHAQNEPFTGKIKLFNRGKKIKRVSLVLDPPFHTEKEFETIAGESAKELTIQAIPLAPGFFQGKIIAQSAPHHAIAQTQLKSLRETKLEMISSSDFGKRNLDQKIFTNNLLIANRGEVTWLGKVETLDPFYLPTKRFEVGAGKTQVVEVIFRPLNQKKFQEKIIFTEEKTGRAQSFPLLAESFLSHSTNQVSPLFGDSFSSVAALPFQKNIISSEPLLALTGLYQKMVEPEKALIKWKSREDPALFRLYQNKWQWNADKSRVIEQWQWLEDVPCERLDSDSLGFFVDRLRPKWSYAFSIWQVDETGHVLGKGNPFFIATPASVLQPVSYKIWMILGATLLVGLGFWALKNINRWFGGALGG
ncbi:MAG: hypothetical protein K1X66_01550 [Verrucomicrobiae bacterium]|nr:hypothetical protein [Verrucomicrobiae bacterium]